MYTAWYAPVWTLTKSSVFDHSHFYYYCIVHITIRQHARGSHISHNDLLLGRLHEIWNAAQIDGTGQDSGSFDALYHILAQHLKNSSHLWSRYENFGGEQDKRQFYRNHEMVCTNYGLMIMI